MKTKSIEEKVEDIIKSRLDSLLIRRYGKNEEINDFIEKALKNAPSKSGNTGNNFPDIKLLLKNSKSGRNIPVMIEIKGTTGKLSKTDKNGSFVMTSQAVSGYAVNGALHYGQAILDGNHYTEVIVIGVNGTLDTDKTVKLESEAYYLSKKNLDIPKQINIITKDDWSILKESNLDTLYNHLDLLNLTESEIEELKKKAEATLEERIKSIHQSLYEDERLKTTLTTNEKLYLFCGLIMAGMENCLDINSLKGFNYESNHDGKTILNSISGYLESKGCPNEKKAIIENLLKDVFNKRTLWSSETTGESILKELYKQVQDNIIPCLNSDLRLDFTGKILNSLNDWVSIENDKQNDVVLTPRYITNLMARMARTDRNSFVWDAAMGSGGFLVSAMDIMIKDAQENIIDKEELDKKIKDIKENHLLGIEILGNIYVLAVLNMILMGDGSSKILNGDSHDFKLNSLDYKFPANVFLLNPPYSAPGKGFCFVEEALAQMETGYACILIQDSSGNGQGLPYTKRILEKHTLETSIKMPSGLFGNKASVSVYIFVFKINRPHEEDDIVTFVDFSEDGYQRLNRKKSNQEVNLRDTDHAKDRYEEVLAITLKKKPKTEYYTEANGKVIKDTISLAGNDWLFTQHQKIDTTPTEEDFKRTVANYLSWKVSQLMKG